MKKALPKNTITCQHCRYERPAGDARCHICGYPWPWAEKEHPVTNPRGRATQARKRRKGLA